MLMTLSHCVVVVRTFSVLSTGGGSATGSAGGTKNPGLNLRNFRMLNATVFSTRPNRSCSIPAWAHFPPRITRENAAGSWWSGCLKCRIKLLRVEKFKKHSEFNSSLIFMRETYELFSRKSMETGRTDPQEIPAERPVHNFPGDQILTFSFSIKARAVADHFASSVVSTRQTYSPPSCSFSRL